MRAEIITIAAMLIACDRPGGRPGPPPGGGVILPPIETSTGEGDAPGPRLDLGDWPELSTSSTSDMGSSGTGGVGTSTGEGSTTDEGTSSGTSGTGSGTSGTSDASTGGSTGEPLPACPCTAEAAAAMNLCGLPPGTCEPVKPGGYCDPNGDSNFADGDWVLGWEHWSALCN